MINENRRKRLVQQGYGDINESELEAIAPWLRLYPGVCAVLMGVATLTSSSILFYGLMIVALISTFYKHHPIDVIYNLFISPQLGTPQLPPNRLPRRAACGVASLGLFICGYSFGIGHELVGLVLGIGLTAAAALKATTDYCPISHGIYAFSPDLARKTSIV